MASVYDLLARCIDWATGNAKVQLTGRNVEEVYIINALAIRDTNPYFSPTIDTSKYRNIMVIASSTLDQPATVQARLRDSGYMTYIFDGTSWKSDGDLATSLPASSGNRYVLNTKQTILNQSAVKSLAVRVQCTTAPTAGSLTVLLWGVPN